MDRGAWKAIVHGFIRKVSRNEDSMLSVDGLRADEFIERHLGL